MKQEIRLVKKEELRHTIWELIANNEIRYYIYDITRSVINENKINFDNITKRVEKHFKEKIENNIHKLNCYYEKYDGVGTDYNIVFWINEYIHEEQRYFTFKEKITLQFISWANDKNNLTIEKIDDTLNKINDNLIYYKYILENIDDIIEENNKIYNSIMEFKQKYDNGIYTDIMFLLNRY